MPADTEDSESFASRLLESVGYDANGGGHATYEQVLRIVSGEKPVITVARLREATEILRQLRDRLPTNFGDSEFNRDRARQLDGSMANIATLLFLEVNVNIRATPPASDSQRSFLFGQIIDATVFDALTERAKNLLSPSPDRRKRKLEVELEKLLEIWDSVLQEAATSIEQAQDTIAGVAWQVPSQIYSLTFRGRSKSIQRMEEAAFAQLEAIQRITGEGGKERLAGTFADEAKKSRHGASYWTLAVFMCIAAGIALPALILTYDKFVFTEVAGNAGFVIKALTGVPLFALAAYCGRIASQHRDMARHMTILTAQIDSVSAYVNDLPQQDRYDIKIMLGKRAYSDPGLATRDKGKVGAIPDDVKPIIEKALDMAKEVIKKDVGRES